jgi:hypothetical protein
MEFASIFDVLVRYRRLVVLGLVPALLAGAVIGLRGPAGGSSNRVGETVSASARVLLQGPDSLPVDLNPKASDSVAARARMIGDLMASDAARTDIARRAGLALAQLTVVTPTSGTVEDPVPIGIEGAAAARAKTSFVLTVGADGSIPILTLSAGAPTGVQAVRVVTAAEEGLAQLVSAGRSQGDGLRVLPLGAPRTQVVGASSKLPLGVAAALVFFGFWCMAVVLLTAALSGLHERGAAAAPHQYAAGRSVSSQ